MDELKEMQTMWQKQHVPAGVPEGLRDLIQKLDAHEKRQRRIDTAKTVGVCVFLLPLVWLVANHGQSPLVSAGALWMAASAAAFMVAYSKKQFHAWRLNFTQPSSAFSRAAIAQLNGQRELFHHYFLLFLLNLVGGMNLLLVGLEAGSEAAVRSRIAAHVVASVIPILASVPALKIRQRRFEKECQPLIVQLETFGAPREPAAR